MYGRTAFPLDYSPPFFLKLPAGGRYVGRGQWAGRLSSFQHFGTEISRLSSWVGRLSHPTITCCSLTVPQETCAVKGGIEMTPSLLTLLGAPPKSAERAAKPFSKSENIVASQYLEKFMVSRGCKAVNTIQHNVRDTRRKAEKPQTTSSPNIGVEERIDTLGGRRNVEVSHLRDPERWR